MSGCELSYKTSETFSIALAHQRLTFIDIFDLSGQTSAAPHNRRVKMMVFIFPSDVVCRAFSPSIGFPFAYFAMQEIL